MNAHRWLVTLLVAVVLVGGGLGVSTGTVSAAPEQDPPFPARVFTDDPSIVDGSPLRVDSWSRTDEGLALHFSLGSPDCFGVHAEVEDTPDAVTVGPRTGRLSAATGRMCTMIVVFGILLVPLRSPLGDRAVVVR